MEAQGLPFKDFSFRKFQGSPLAEHSSLPYTQKFDFDFQWEQMLWFGKHLKMST